MNEETNVETPDDSGSVSSHCYAERVLRTERFDILHVIMRRDERIGYPRDVYQAWFHSEDVAAPACTVTINVNTGLPAPHYIEWINTHELFRRQGIATEVLQGIVSLIGPIDVEGATDDWEAFEDSWRKVSA